MIIIVRSPDEIKRFLEDINNLAGDETVQRFVQQEYAESCYAFEKQSLSEISGSARQFQGASMNVPWTMIQSSKTRQFDRPVIVSDFRLDSFLLQVRNSGAEVNRRRFFFSLPDKRTEVDSFRPFCLFQITIHRTSPGCPPDSRLAGIVPVSGAFPVTFIVAGRKFELRRNV